MSTVFFSRTFCQTTQEPYTSTTTWTCPEGIYQIQVECWGGGGAGGGATGSPAAGGGGAGGSYAIKTLAVNPGNSYTVTVGSGGTGSTGAGGTGGVSWFSTAGTVYAQGGAGGAAATVNSTNGAGGTGSSALCIGDLVYAGGNGAAGIYTSGTPGGAGGGGAGSTGAGGNASAGVGGTGTSMYGGNGANGVANSTNGASGSTYGGAGSGGKANSAADKQGGAGASGYIVITYTRPTSPGAITSDAPQCEGTGITFTQGTCTSGCTCYWVSSATGTETTNSSSTYTTATTAGIYNVWVRARDNTTGNWSTAVTASGTVASYPSATASSNSPVCAGDPLALTSGPASMASYAWAGPNSYSSSEQNPTVSSSFTSAMAGTYTVTVTNSSSCSASAAVNVSENFSAPSCASNYSPASGSSVSPAGATFSWDAVTGAAGYYVYFDQNPTPTTLVSTQTGLTYNTGALTVGETYYWLIIPFNSCGSASSCTVQYFNVGCTSPTTQASDVYFTSVCATSLTANWSRGDGNNCAVFIKNASSGTASPVNGTTYTANTVFGSGTQIGSTGWYCINNGTGTSVSVTGLTLGSTYIVHVVEYMTTDICYLTSVAYNNPVATLTFACTAPCASITTIEGCGVDYAQTANFAATSGSVDFTNCFSGGTPGDEKMFSFVAPYTGTYDIQVVYGPTTTFFVDYFWSTTCSAASGDWNCIGDITHNGHYGNMSWTAGVTYYILLDAGTNLETGTQTFYINCPEGCEAPTSQSYNAALTSSCIPITVSWTRPVDAGKGDSCVVFMSASSSGAAAPIDGSVYNASSIFGVGDQVSSSGWYCIYNGSGTSMLVTGGITPGSTYRVHVCEYNCTGVGTRYYTATATNNPANVTLSSSACYTHSTAGMDGSSCGTCMTLISGTATYTDDGLGGGGNYSNNINNDGSAIYRTFCPASENECLTAYVNSISLASGAGDILRVYYGASPCATCPMSTISTAGTTYTSTDPSGCLSFRFGSDEDNNAAGWDITLTSASCAAWQEPANSDCSTAIPTCSSVSFDGNSLGPGLESSCGTSCLLTEFYTAWYVWDVEVSGSLGLTITTKNSASDDYDFALYKASSCSEISSPIRCSFADNTKTGYYPSLNAGVTGMIPDNDVSETVAGDGHYHGWVDTLGITVGERYYLMVDQYTMEGNGFDLTFDFYSSGGSISCPELLPVELVGFNAFCKNDTVYMDWTTLSETNNDFFIIERSKNAVEWEPASYIEGSGNSNESIFYSHSDISPLDGLSYYRLKQIDFDGAYSYSDPVKVFCGDNNTPLSLIVTNTDGAVSMTMASGKADYSLSIFDITGKLVYNNEIENNKTASQQILFGTEMFRPGLYIVYLRSMNEKTVKKFLIN